MSDMPTWGGSPDDSRDSTGPGETEGPAPRRAPRRKHRGLRIALVSLASFVLLVGAIAAGGYAFLNHLAGGIQRIPVHFTKLEAAGRSVGGYDSYGGAMTVLITGQGLGAHRRHPYHRSDPEWPDHAAPRQRFRLQRWRGVGPAAVHR